MDLTGTYEAGTPAGVVTVTLQASPEGRLQGEVRIGPILLRLAGSTDGVRGLESWRSLVRFPAMKLALVGVAMAVIPATAAADAGRTRAGACPTGAHLVELARRAFPDAENQKNAPIAPNDLVCHVLRARVATWLITFAHTGCGDVGAGAAAIVQNGAVTWSEQGFYGPGTPCHGGTWQAADLDGDGNDELLWFQESMGHESSGHRSLTVMAVANGEPTERDQLGLASRGSAEGNGHYSWDCSASYRLVPAPHGAQWIELVGHRYARDPDDRCPKDGRHVYAWKAGKLIER